ncbi:SDR family oxidoreductase [Glycomyces albidus]|jgi:nucleoside-diphosphate-sugar epimerase|uniref:NAD-dependent epimerase/dehydratase family protein n=1 Tax=Glycomyces albidus TaxID=2656774 RepID=A0A6L5G9L0_9ACTN|nr:SDR family oxidoreductase [Glycomyces albidus]MQM26290.1 NAD-dependent epimerase/dehydratase family protein [Glycomyces albidus]
MRVFITGASGWIGSAVVPELIGAGHRVAGLARSDASAAALAAAGVEVRRGSLDDFDVLREEAGAADAVVHLAFKHDLAFSGRFGDAVAADRAVVEAIGDALAGTGKAFALASGTPESPGAVATEDDGHDFAPDRPGPMARMATAEYLLGLAARGVRSIVLRFPPTVHGEGDHGFIAALVGVAREKGLSGYIGDGTSRWAAVHRADAAVLVRLAIERAPAGSTLHAVADEGVPMRDIAAVVGRHLGVPTASVAPEDAAAHFGWLAAFAGADRAGSSARTRELLDWEPTHPGLVEDLEKGHYFETGRPQAA